MSSFNMLQQQTKWEGCGRGGRGALLLQALRNQARRPGNTGEQGSGDGRERAVGQDKSSPAEESGQGEQVSKPSAAASFGRGRLLQLALQKDAASKAQTAVSLSVDPNPPTVVTPSASFPIGRGFRGRGTLFQPLMEASVPSEPLSSPPVETGQAGTSKEDVSLPTTAFGSVSLKEKRSGPNEGKKVTVEVNYINLKVKPGMGVFEYHVSFMPQVDSKNMRFKIMNQDEVKNIIGKTKTFDGGKLFLPIKLKDNEIKISSKIPTDNSSVTVTIKFVGEGKASEYIHLYNVLFRKIMFKLKMTNIGRNFFDSRGGIDVPQHKLEVWPGYITSIQEYDGGVMLNCDASFRVLRKVTALDILTEISCTQRSQFQDVAAKQLVGCVVLTRYNNKTYRIDDIAWDLTPRSTFTYYTGQQISYKDYYKKCYDIDIRDEGQPLLIHRPKKKFLPPGTSEDSKLICLIPELAFLTGLTDEMRSDFKVMKDIATHTRVTPSQRQLAIKRFVHNVNSTEETAETLAEWGLKLDSAAVKLQGTELPNETIYFKNKEIKANKECDWGRDASQNGVIVPVDLECWIVVFTKRDSTRANDFINMMKKVCTSFGFRASEPMRVELQNDRTESYLREIRDRVNPLVQIVVAVFPTPRDDRYSAIKKLCCVDMPIPSQVINSKTIGSFQKLRSVTQKIALQINCKLGGELWALNIPFKNAMVCGFDSYHDSSAGKRSVLGFVASLNKSLTRWFSMAKFQQSGQELGDSLKFCLLSALRKYHEVNHMLPDRIFIYRDGVSDGQLEHVAKYEVEQFSSCFKHFEQAYNPSLSVIVVQKRINTRIFLSLGSDELANPAPGSVVDYCVTRKNWYDFFLVSQHVRQGTVTPTHYVTVHDSNNLAPFLMQRFTYKLTHLYYNWPGTVRVPAPCQYAHKLAYLVGQSIHKEPSSQLTDKLFFL